MALTKLERDMKIISKLDDEPNDVGGLTAAELKAKFDEAGEVIKEFLNNTLIPELASEKAGEQLGVTLRGDSMTLQEALNILQAAAIQSGNVPIGGNEGEYLRKKSGELYDLEWASVFTAFAFAAADWVQGEDGLYTITVPQESHRRRSGEFGCALRHSVDGVLKSNTWAVLGTQSVYDNDTGEITLLAPDAYDGTAIFYG